MLVLFAPDRDVAADQADGTAAWVVADLSGAAFSRPGNHEDGSWRTLSAGTAIDPGSLVRTEPGGKVTLSNGADRIKLSGSSEIELPAAAAADGFTRVIHWIGSAFFDVDSQSTPHFEVDTPYLVATVKGTKFTTTVSDAGASVKVDEGVVGVSTTDGADGTDLTAGEAASVSAEDTGKVAPGKLSDSPAPADGDDPAAPADVAPEADAKANGNSGNGGGKGNRGGNGGRNSGGNGNGCHGNGGCHHDDDDDDDDDDRGHDGGHGRSGGKN